MERFEPETVSEMIDIYGSGDALRDAREYVSAIESAMKYASQTLQRLNNHIDRMQAVRPLATSIPFGSSERASVGRYIRQKNGGLLELNQWSDSFDIFIPEAIFESVSDLVRTNFIMHDIGNGNRQYCFHEKHFTPTARKHPKELTSIIQRLYFAHDALRRIGECYRECKDINKAIKGYEAGIGISE